MESFKIFYIDILQKKRFYLPIILFCLVAYSFSIYNRTVSYDDLMREYYYGVMLSGRWGMCFWVELLGLLEFDPFIDRFVSLCFYVFTAILVCFLVFCIDRNKNILSYTMLTSAFITYPLINEIWEYGGANFALTGGLCLSTLAAIIIKCSNHNLRTIIYSSIALLLPVSSYESAAFYYLSIVCMIIFYEDLLDAQHSITVKKWLREVTFYISPLVIAILLRFSISFIIIIINGLSYSSGGATGIGWFSTEFTILHVVASMIAHSFINYCLAALVYLPIFVFCVFLLLFLLFIFLKKRRSVIILGILLILSLFSQSFLQCAALPYRNAQSIALFVAFVVYLISIYAARSRRYLRCLVYIVFFGLCWHQAVFMNRILCLNNLRSDNEISAIRQIGGRIVSEFENKPVAFVSPYYIGPWINKQVTVNESSWNGKLFYSIHDKIKKVRRPYKFIATNINSSTGEYPQIELLLKYCGYDIDVIKPRPNPHSKDYSKKDFRILNDAIAIAKEKDIKPYQIYDNGDYLIVNLGGAYFKDGFPDDNPYAEE